MWRGVPCLHCGGLWPVPDSARSVENAAGYDRFGKRREQIGIVVSRVSDAAIDRPAGHGGGRIRPQHGVQFAFAGGDFTEPRRPMLRPEENRHAIMQRC